MSAMTSQPSDIEQRRAALQSIWANLGLAPDMCPEPLAVNAHPAPADPEEPRHAARDASGILLPQPWQDLTDAEFALLSPVLPDAPQSRITQRRFLDLIGSFVVEGTSWASIGAGERFTAVREKSRRERGRACWFSALRHVNESITDAARREQLTRVLRYIVDGDPSTLAVRQKRKR